MNSLKTLIKEYMNMKIQDVSDESVQRAKWILLDSLLVTWYGVRSNEIQAYIQTLSEQRNNLESCGVIGESLKTSTYHQLMIHGTAMVSHEMDEGNQYAKGHPAAHVFPVLVAAAYSKKISGEKFLQAFIIGYEVCSYFAEEVKLRDDMHPHGTWGMIGGTVAAGILQNKSLDEIVEAIYLSASLPLATSWEAAVEGQSVRNLYVGIACWNAYNALELQSYGFKSNQKVVNHIWGNIMSRKSSKYPEESQKIYPLYLSRNYLKIHPACRFSHASIDAINQIIYKKEIIVEEIHHVKILTYNLAARLNNPNPQTLLAAKFSIPFLISVILNGYTLYELQNESIFYNKKIRDFAKKIIVIDSERINKLLPHHRAAEVSIHFENGECINNFVDTALGEAQLPLPMELLKKKYKYISHKNVQFKYIDKIIQESLNLEKFKDITEWIELIKTKKEIEK